MKTFVRLLQLAFALTFFFSGLAKCIDPLGTSIKIAEYLRGLSLSHSFLTEYTLGLAWGLSLLEFICGFNLLLGHGRLFALFFSTCLLFVFTPLTAWVYLTGAVKDCGCFGDALHLSALATFLKNIALFVTVMVMWKKHGLLYRLLPNTPFVLYRYIALGIVVLLCLLGTWREPFVDFRSYPVGIDLRAAVTGSSSTATYTCIYKKGDLTREFTLDNLPDEKEGWEFVDTITHEGTSEADHTAVDFYVFNEDGHDYTEDLLQHTGATLLLLSPSLDNASQHDIDRIEQLSEWASDYSVPFFCLTQRDEAQRNRWCYNTGAEYAFLYTDASIIETICRSNPAVMLLWDGKIIQKQPLAHFPMSLLSSGKLDEQTALALLQNTHPHRFFWLLALLLAPSCLHLLLEKMRKLQNPQKL